LDIAHAADLHPTDVLLGQTIRSRREAAHITQAQLAARVGVTFQQIQKYERGVNRVAASRLVEIAKALETSAGALLGEEEAAFAVPEAGDMLRAFCGIEDSSRRTAVLALARSLAAGT
jgi:transcriptional regulator with XRE-family HTH domain